MFIEVVILSVIIGYLARGSLKNFKDAELKHAELIFAGFAIEIIMVLMIQRGIFINSAVRYVLYMLMYIMLFIFVYFNRRYVSVLIMGAGFLLNAIAIFSNGGVMPVSPAAMEKAGMGGMISTISNQGLYSLMDDSTAFSFLCDVIPRPYPRAFVISAGDIVIAIGLLLLILKLMGCTGKLKKKDTY